MKINWFKILDYGIALKEGDGYSNEGFYCIYVSHGNPEGTSLCETVFRYCLKEKIFRLEVINHILYIELCDENYIVSRKKEIPIMGTNCYLGFEIFAAPLAKLKCRDLLEV